MEYEVLEDDKLILRTHLVGYVDIFYSDLINKLGPSNMDYGDDYKMDAHWIVKIDDVTVTIYNWKDGVAYNGEDGTPVNEITDWHIGGQDKSAVAAVKLLFPENVIDPLY
jgi:hypothetical protein